MSDPLRALEVATGKSQTDGATDFPNIPAVPNTDSPGVANFLSSVKQWLEKASGSGLTGFASKKDLVSAGIGQVTPGGGFLPVVPDMAVPPAPTGLLASGAMTNIIVEWSDPNAKYGNHGYTEVWAAQINNFSTAVLVSTASGFMFAHAVGEGSTRYYWIRFVSTSGVKGPFNSVSGTLGQTSNSPTYMLGLLSGQLSASQLNAALNSRIDLIDGPNSLSGSVNARLQTVQSQINDLLLIPGYLSGTTYTVGNQVTYGGKIYRAKSTTTGNLPTNTTYWELIGDYSTLGETVAAHTAQIGTLTTGLGAEVTARETLAVGVATKGRVFRQSTAPTSGMSEGDIWINTASSYTAAQDYFASDYSTPRHKMYQYSSGGWVDSTDGEVYDNTAAIQSESSVRASADDALAVSLTALTTRVGTAESAIVTEQSARASGDAANASSITTLQTTVGGHTTSIETQQTSIDGLRGQYTVKIDNDGYVSGFGLASTATNATPFSEFQIVADKFSIAPVATSHSAADGSPFFYLTTPTTINGVSVPAGAYMKSAYIHDASITNAKIQNAAIDSAKIADASIVTAKIQDAAISTAKINDAAITTAKIGTGAITTALIGDAQIKNANIEDLSVNSIKIAGNSVTISQNATFSTGKRYWGAGDGSHQGAWSSAGIYAYSLNTPQGVIVLFSIKIEEPVSPDTLDGSNSMNIVLYKNGSLASGSLTLTASRGSGLSSGFFVDTSPGYNPYYQLYSGPYGTGFLADEWQVMTATCQIAILTTIK